jgi:hypothetical protein
VLFATLQHAKRLAVDLIQERVVLVGGEMLELAVILEALPLRPCLQLSVEVVLRRCQGAKLFRCGDGEGLDFCRRHALVAAQPCELRLVSSELRLATLHRNGGIRSLQRLPDDRLGVSMYEFGGDAQDELVLAAVGALVDVLRHHGNGRTNRELQGSTSSRGPRARRAQGARFVPRSDALKSRYAVDQ